MSRNNEANDSSYIAALNTENLNTIGSIINSGFDINEQIQGKTMLTLAVREDKIRVVDYLLNNGAQPDIATQDGYTPLIIASSRGHSEVVNLLLTAGANVDARTNDDATALLVASQNGHLEIVNRLLEAGANVDARMNYGATALLVASQNGHLEIVNSLLEAGAKVETPMNDGTTPLLAAAEWGRIEIVNRLLEAGARTDATTHNGLTPLYAAEERGYIEIVNSLLKAQIEVDKSKYEADKESIIKFLTPIQNSSQDKVVNSGSNETQTSEIRYEPPQCVISLDTFSDLNDPVLVATRRPGAQESSYALYSKAALDAWIQGERNRIDQQRLERLREGEPELTQQPRFPHNREPYHESLVIRIPDPEVAMFKELISTANAVQNLSASLANHTINEAAATESTPGTSMTQLIARQRLSRENSASSGRSST